VELETLHRGPEFGVDAAQRQPRLQRTLQALPKKIIKFKLSNPRFNYSIAPEMQVWFLVSSSGNLPIFSGRLTKIEQATFRHEATFDKNKEF
jgi:hypothetical protein